MARGAGLRRLTASEHEIQCAFVARVRANVHNYRDLAFLRAFPNGGARPSRVDKKGNRFSVMAIKMKAEGVAPGPLDIILPARRRDYVGLWFEFKVPGERMTPAQKEYAAYLDGQGWYVGTWFDHETAWADVKRYLELPTPPCLIGL